MRTEPNRKKVKDLYVFGAGASHSISFGNTGKKVAPLDAQFCKVISELDSPKWIKEAARRIEADFIHHLDFSKIGLEELICQQLSDLSFIKSICPRKLRGKRSPEDFLDDLTHVIAHCLKFAKSRKPDKLEAFLDKTLKGKNETEVKNRIITFNYDSIVDDILLKRFSPQQLYFNNIRNGEDDASGEKSPLLLKLHGSINWRCTKLEYKKLFDESKVERKGKTRTYNTDDCHYIDDIFYDSSACKTSDCNIPLIIPPVPQKPITSVAIFKYLWTYAFEYLTEAERIILVGYSLPPTDTLAISLFSKFNNKHLTDLTIIDPNEAVLGKWIKLFKRKGVRSHKVHYYQDFSEYINGNS